MDHKTWLWRKRSSEKTIAYNGEEAQPIVIKREVELENSLKTLNDKLACVLDECSAKDELVQSCEKMANEAIADKKKAEEEVRLLQEELDEAVQQKVAANDRLSHLNSALKDCMEQLNQIRNELEQRVLDGVTKTTKELEKAHKKLEEKLSENNERIANMASENSFLSNALLVKEKMIEELSNIKSQTEAEFQALMTRLDSTEKENTFLRYEFQVLQRELEHRNEEVEYCRHSAEAAQKQHFDDVKKIKRLDADCQRLRGLMRKRLPCSSVLANIKSDIELQGRDFLDSRRKFSTGGLVSRDVYGPVNATKKLSFLNKQVQDLEKENKILRECLAKKEKIFHYQEAKPLELTISRPAPDEHSRTTKFDAGEKHPRPQPEGKIIGASEMSLMDDFVEMEKLAIVAVDVPFPSPHVSWKFSNSSKETNVVTKDLVLVGNNEFGNVDPSSPKPDDWLQNVTNMVSEQLKTSKRSVEELLGDIRMALQSIVHHGPPKLLPITGYIGWKSPTSSPSSNLNLESSYAFSLYSDANAAVRKIMELVGQVYVPCSRDSNSFPYEHTSKVPEYRVHVFRWKSCSLTSVLKEFLHSCNNLLDGKIDFEKFIGDMASTLEWFIRNCTSYEDHSTVRDEFRKHLCGDGPGTAFELECVQSLMLEMEKMYSMFQVEIKGLKNEKNIIQLDKESNASRFSGGHDNVDLTHKLQQWQEIVASLQKELEILKESRTTEDHIENLKTINEDLDTQLTVTRAKLNEVQQKLSCAQVELDSKNHCYEELEGTCLELQLQIESMINKHSEDSGGQEELLRTGLEITRASAKLAECEETILKLGKQLNAYGSSKELSVVNKVLSITSAKNKKLKQQRSSLRDQFHAESNRDKQMVCKTEANAPSISRASSHNVLSLPDCPVAATDKFLKSKNGKAGALVIIPGKKWGRGMGFLAKLLLRRKKVSSTKASLW